MKILVFLQKVSIMIEKIGKYNFWNGNSVELGYRRHSYTEKIGKYVGNRLIKVLTGQRRAGKSFILRQIANQLLADGVPVDNILYINKEYIEYGQIDNYMDLQSFYEEYMRELAPSGKVWLFIDEVQYIDGWEKFVNSHAQDFAEQCEIFLCGSNSCLLSGELASMLSGRYVQFEVLPYSFREYCEVSSLSESKDSYLKYIHSGALPELFNLSDEEMRRNYVSSLKDTVMFRDIMQRYSLKDGRLLDDLFTYVVNNAASLVSVRNIINWFASKKRKTNYETVSTYLGYIESSYLIHRAERYNIRGKDTVAGNVKYYANDLAYRNYLYGGFGYGDGYLLENAVYLELRRQGYDVYVGNVGNKEVDFVAMKGDDRVYYQVAMTVSDHATFEREYSPLRMIPDSFRKCVVTLDDYHIPSENGIVHLLPWEI